MGSSLGGDLPVVTATGTAITVAAAAALQELGSSAAIVATPSSNVGAVATETSALQ